MSYWSIGTKKENFSFAFEQITTFFKAVCRFAAEPTFSSMTIWAALTVWALSALDVHSKEGYKEGYLHCFLKNDPFNKSKFLELSKMEKAN